jgi:hypothetical protein
MIQALTWRDSAEALVSFGTPLLSDRDARSVAV